MLPCAKHFLTGFEKCSIEMDYYHFCFNIETSADTVSYLYTRYYNI